MLVAAELTYSDSTQLRRDCKTICKLATTPALNTVPHTSVNTIMVLLGCSSSTDS